MTSEARTRVGGVQWSRVSDDPTIKAPAKAYAGDAGWDLAARVAVRIPPGEYRDVPTGIAVALPEGYYMRLVARSSTFRQKGLLLVEGVIDAGFRGELFACVYNPSGFPIWVAPGDRLMQAIVSPFYEPTWSEVERLPASARGANGFGSSGS